MAPKQTFQFVFGNDVESRRKARQHVMRDFRSRKRLRDILDYQERLSKLNGGPISSGDLRSHRPKAELENPASSRSTSPRTYSSPLPWSELSPWTRMPSQTSSPGSSNVCFGPDGLACDHRVEEVPREAPGTFGTDPFSAYPVQCTPREHAIVNHCESHPS